MKSRTTKAGQHRIPRTDEDLLNSLIIHLSLLEEFIERAFQVGDSRYLGEVAGKIRLLCHRGGKNKPLLLDLMKKYESEVLVPVDWPKDRAPQSLEEYLDGLAVFHRTPEGPIQLSKIEIAVTWAQQHGAAHEDPSLEYRVAFVRSVPVQVGSLHASAAALRAGARTVASVGRTFLDELVAKGILTRKNEV